MTAMLTLKPPAESLSKLRPATVGEWLEALESGRYSKTKGRLRDRFGYCCLGVAADIEGAGWLGFEGYYSSEGVCRTSIDEGGDSIGSGGMWLGADGGELAEFLRWVAPTGQVGDELATINDRSDTFEPVIARARELHALWLEDRRARHGPDTP